jgi:cell wall-associated NlpC family hydrolase
MRARWLGGGVGVLALPVLGLGLAGASALGPRHGALAPSTVPASFSGLVSVYGNGCPELSPALLAAQLYVESGFNPDAVSSAGAEGIAQFMPATWAAHGVDANGDGVADVWDPADAVPSAAAYDCQLAGELSSVPGDPTSNMLAAYNAGVYAVLQNNGVPPYPQTEAYVSRILALEPSFAAVTGTVPTTSAAAAAVAFAQAAVGIPYEWGGNGSAEANGEFDCSGLTQAAYAISGISLPHNAAAQWYSGTHIAADQLRPGDLVFFATNLKDPSTIHHVGIYIGNGQMIDAPHTGAVVRAEPDDWPDFIGAIRLSP